MARTVEITLLGIDLLSRAMTSSARATKKLQNGLEGLSKVGKGAGIAAAAGQISALGAAAAPAAAAVLALPAALASVQAATLTVKVGIKGVGDAMEAVASGDAKKMEAALKKLTPAAREFVKETSNLKKAFEPVQKVVQENLFEGLGEKMKKVGTSLMPTLEKGMGKVATALNGIAQEALDFAASPLFKNQLAQIFEGTAQAADILKGAVKPLMTIFVKLGTLGQPLINRFLAFIKVQATAGGAFMSSADGAKKMSDLMTKAGDVIAQLGRIVTNVGKGIFNIFKNGDEGAKGMLSSIEQLTQKFSSWSSSTAGQEKSAELFKTLNELAKAITQTLVMVGGALGVVYMTFQKLPGPVKGAVIQFLAFSVVLAPLAAKLMSVFKVVGLLGTGLGKMVKFFRAGPSGISPFAAMLTKVKNALIAVRMWIVRTTVALKAKIVAIWSSVKAWAASAGAMLKNAAMAAANLARIIATTIATAALTVATKLWAAATWLVNMAMRANPIVLIITLLVALGIAVVVMYKKFDWFRKIVDACWAGIQKAIKFAWDNVIKPVWEAIKAFITNILIPVFKAMWSAIKVVWSGIQTAIKFAWNNIIKPIWNAIKTYITMVLIPAFKNIADRGKSLFNALGSGIRAVWNNFIKPAFNAIKTGLGAVKTAFETGVDGIKRLWNKLEDILKKPVKFFVDTVYTGGVRKVWSAVRNVVPALPDLPSVSFAKGGIVPGGYKPGKDTVLAMMSPGEGVLRPEATRAIGSNRLNQINAAAKAGGAARVSKMLGLYPDGGDASGLKIPGIAGYADGGIIGKVKGALKKPIDWGKAAASKVMEFGVEKFANGILDPIIRMIPEGEGLWGKAMFGIPKSALEGFKKFVKDVLVPGMGGAGGPGMAGALEWAKGEAGKPYVWGGVGPNGYDCCIIGTVRVYGPHGATPIKDVQAGDEVFSYVNGKLSAQVVTAAWQSQTQRVYKVRTRNRSVTASANHPFMRVVMVEPSRHVKGGKRGEQTIARYGVEWARLDELQRGDLLVQSRAMDVEPDWSPTLPDGTPVDTDVAWLIGAVVGDGTVSDRALRLCMYGDDRDRSAEIITARWTCNPSYGQNYGLLASNVQMARALAGIGMRCVGPDKRVPAVVWTWSRELRQAFLDGYCDADGHRPADGAKHGDRTYSSASRELIEDVRALHIMLGQPVSNITTNNRTKPITIKGVLVKEAKPLHTFTVWQGEGRGEAALRRRKGLAAWLDEGDFTIARVLAVTDEGIQETFDLEVEGAHNFIADGVVVHNSGFMSALVNKIKGKSPYSRLFTTHAFTGAEGPSGFQRDMASGFRVGVTHGGVGHMAGTLMGTNVESSGSAGVRVGGGARGADDGLFTTRYGLKADTGALALRPGWNPPVMNGTGRMEYLETPRQGTGNNYSIYVTVAPGGNPVEAGSATVKAIQAFERVNGKKWRS